MSLVSPLSADETLAHDREEITRECLDGFRQAQQLAYACVTHIESTLKEGLTEVEATAKMDAYLRDKGVREYFHRPFAWFGDRTAFRQFRTVRDFFPTRRALEPGMPVILDVAPIVEGFTSDIGYAFSFGENRVVEQMLADLEPYRALILEGVRARKLLSDIYGDVDALIEKQGYENRHQRYPYRVLAHRVTHVPRERRSERTVAGFGVPALRYFGERLLQQKRGIEHSAPFWNDRPSSRRPPDPGLWAVEPHLGFRGVGVKWEELLVITENDAYWLDDDLPHVRRWKKGAPSRSNGSHAEAAHDFS